jgi:hypothetical protein
MTATSVPFNLLRGISSGLTSCGDGISRAAYRTGQGIYYVSKYLVDSLVYLANLIAQTTQAILNKVSSSIKKNFQKFPVNFKRSKATSLPLPLSIPTTTSSQTKTTIPPSGLIPVHRVRAGLPQTSVKSTLVRQTVDQGHSKEMLEEGVISESFFESSMGIGKTFTPALQALESTSLPTDFEGVIRSFKASHFQEVFDSPFKKNLKIKSPESLKHQDVIDLFEIFDAVGKYTNYPMTHTNIARIDNIKKDLQTLIESMLSGLNSVEKKRFVMRMNMCEAPWASDLREIAFNILFDQKDTGTYTASWHSIPDQVRHLRQEVDKLKSLFVDGVHDFQDLDLPPEYDFLRNSYLGYQRLNLDEIKSVVEELDHLVSTRERYIESGGYVELPMYYHATPQNQNAISILEGGTIDVRHQKAFKGAFTSTLHEKGYGKFCFALPNTLGLEDKPLHHLFDKGTYGSINGGKVFWLGFAEAINVSQAGGRSAATYLIAGGTEEEKHNLIIDLHENHGINTAYMPVVSPEMANLERIILQKLRGLPFPKHFSDYGKRI